VSVVFSPLGFGRAGFRSSFSGLMGSGNPKECLIQRPSSQWKNGDNPKGSVRLASSLLCVIWVVARDNPIARENYVCRLKRRSMASYRVGMSVADVVVVQNEATNSL